MQQADYYAILGVPRTASKDGIREAYKLKALELHPDKNPEGEAIFKLVVNAYQILRSPTKRRKYDQEIGLREVRRDGPTARAHNVPRPNATERAANAAGPVPNSYGTRTSRANPMSEEKLFEDIFMQYTKGTYGGSAPNSKNNCEGFRRPGNSETSFSEWFKRKQEELRQAEEVCKAKLDYAKQLETEEKKRAEEWRNLQEKREREREEELERERARMAWEEENRRREREAATRQHKAEQEKQKMAEYAEFQKKQQVDLDTHLKELATKKRELEEERRRLATEKEQAQQDTTEQERSRRERQRQREQDIASELQKAELKIIEALAQQAQHEASEKAREAKRKQEEEARLRQEELQRQEEQHQEETLRQLTAEQEEARLKATRELDGKRKALLEQIVLERQRHQDDVEAMRRETDRIEAEMQAKLDALREAKRSGQPINLDEWKL
ncbi:chaperone protein DNAj, putative [Trypanosoma equiperdum]|uniref:Chaperone protein DNAJ, putative n=4 Tax=Trypanozoon TaxID=39700 RepID=Q388D1_TRYB2|nr:chaperone protein DNAj, putative [Trypanosoma brucei gambiense DAL972]XP_827951.1 chaperone protein DnaJ [Trypanosoma brucei brucei TREU927]RHW69181.1 chaperone protein DNAj [Trypanosoma brucei equiperdum]SCU68233.1 chaperone protein DNAj, putative [Trypanosoma equiperdum]EAN78839.1 chaperone protein DNAJ, putative [Trypanosoma brucei brucei TREU927]CBH16686.1 chaperone protein DNAj, putative [Trypanosoma brucei gambiense DAL972]|eukprot:XP_011778950.1 chaperone protein DNAj, putative [Trypanosoma brucei gambiense DAL972]